MKDTLFEEFKESLREVHDHAQGKITLKAKDVVMPETPKPVSAKDVVRIRKKVGASQAVFAKMLNVARDTEISWEQGRRTPSGAAVRLLRIADSHPEHLMNI